MRRAGAFCCGATDRRAALGKGGLTLPTREVDRFDPTDTDDEDEGRGRGQSRGGHGVDRDTFNFSNVHSFEKFSAPR